MWPGCTEVYLPHRSTVPGLMSERDRKRDFLTIPDFSGEELLQVLDLASRMKSGAYRQRPLQGRTLAMLFAKSSTRTRVSFEVGIFENDERVAAA